MLYPNRLTTPPTVTDEYGWRIHPITGVRSFHYGTDSVDHPNGWNGSPEAGVVTFAGYNGGLGNEVRVQGARRLWKLGHHARIDVEVGQQVNEGTVTGPTGTTGNSTGVHCHTECWSGDSSEDAFAFIASNLGGTAGGGSSPFPSLQGSNKMILFSEGKNYHILHAGGVYTFTSSTSEFPNKVAERIGNAIPTDAAFIAAMKAQYAAQNPGAKLPADLRVSAVIDSAALKPVIDALAALGLKIDAVPAEIDRYADGRKQG